MTLIIIGALLLAIGGLFYWLNNNSPVQTPVPMVALPLGAVLAMLGIGSVLL